MDLTEKRRNIAAEAVAAAEQFVDALNALLGLREERSELAEDFVDADFTGSLAHLTAGMVGTLFDFVVPSLQANYLDEANGGRNKQILLQVRH